MKRAIEIAHGNPDAPFGFVIVDRESGEIVAEGLNDAGRHPILHGETVAIMNLVDTYPDVERSRIILYTTVEPCPMCFGAILWTGIRQVIFGTSIANLKRLGVPRIDLPCEEASKCALFGGVKSTGGVL